MERLKARALFLLTGQPTPRGPSRPVVEVDRDAVECDFQIPILMPAAAWW